MQRSLKSLGAIGSIWMAGCSGLTHPNVVCTAEMVPAIVVEIRDARTGAALAYGARGVVRDGAYADSLRPAASSSADLRDLYSRAAAHERAGTYVVEVAHEGYATWTASGVRVPDEVCHVETAELRADLQPLP